MFVERRFGRNKNGRLLFGSRAFGGLTNIRAPAMTSMRPWFRSQEEAAVYLATSCYETSAWAASRLGFLTHALRAPFIFAYWYGDRAVNRVWQRVPRARRKEFWHYLYTNMHTPTTLDAFWN